MNGPGYQDSSKVKSRVQNCRMIRHLYCAGGEGCSTTPSCLARQHELPFSPARGRGFGRDACAGDGATPHDSLSLWSGPAPCASRLPLRHGGGWQTEPAFCSSGSRTSETQSTTSRRNKPLGERQGLPMPDPDSRGRRGCTLCHGAGTTLPDCPTFPAPACPSLQHVPPSGRDTERAELLSRGQRPLGAGGGQWGCR